MTTQDAIEAAFAIVFDVHHHLTFVETVGQTAPAFREVMIPRHAVVAESPAVRPNAAVCIRQRLAAPVAGAAGDPVHLRDACIAKRIGAAPVDQAAA